MKWINPIRFFRSPSYQIFKREFGDMEFLDGGFLTFADAALKAQEIAESNTGCLLVILDPKGIEVATFQADL